MAPLSPSAPNWRFHFPIIMAALLARPAHSFKMRPIAYDAPADEEIEPRAAGGTSGGLPPPMADGRKDKRISVTQQLMMESI